MTRPPSSDTPKSWPGCDFLALYQIEPDCKILFFNRIYPLQRRQSELLMTNNKIGGLPVIDGNKNVVGIITETDIFRAFVELLDPGKTIKPRQNS